MRLPRKTEKYVTLNHVESVLAFPIAAAHVQVPFVLVLLGLRQLSLAGGTLSPVSSDETESHRRTNAFKASAGDGCKLRPKVKKTWLPAES